MESGFWDPQGPIAAAQKAHLLEVFALTMIAILPVFVLVPVFVWRYRYGRTRDSASSKSPAYTPIWEHSFKLETLMWGVPFAIIGMLSVMLFHQTRDHDPYKALVSDKPAVMVDVISLDWKWLFVYPELGSATVGEFAFPNKQPVVLRRTSDTVMQSFMIPALAGQIYTMPGMRTRLHLMSDNTGMFLGENTQYNGGGFSQQRFDAISMEPADFERWVAKVRDGGTKLDAKNYSILAKPSTRAEVSKELGSDGMPENVVYFNDVEPQLFSKIMARYHSGKRVSGKTQPGTEEYEPTAALLGEASERHANHANKETVE